MANFERRKPKRHMTIRVDEALLEKAKEKNINISKVCRYALKLAIEGKLVERTGDVTSQAVS